MAAGIGGLVMDPASRVFVRVSRVRPGLDAFAAEVAALEAVQCGAAERGAERLRAYTDCAALLRRWLEKRTDQRLEKLGELARRFRRFELYTLPRLHNQPANCLARRALALAGGQGTYTPN